MIIRNFQNKQIICYLLNLILINFLLITGILIMVIQDHIKILNFLLHKMETFYKPPLETQECLNQFIVPVFKEVQE